MRRLIAVAALLVSVGSVAWAGVSDDAAQVLQRWSTAFEGKDLEGITRLYAPDALFWGTGSKALVTAPEGVRKYFEQAFTTIGSPKVNVSDQKAQVISDTAVVIATMDAVAGTRDGKEFTSPGRTTWLLVKRDGEWKIVHFHRSSVPK